MRDLADHAAAGRSATQEKKMNALDHRHHCRNRARYCCMAMITKRRPRAEYRFRDRDQRHQHDFADIVQ